MEKAGQYPSIGLNRIENYRELCYETHHLPQHRYIFLFLDKRHDKTHPPFGLTIRNYILGGWSNNHTATGHLLLNSYSIMDKHALLTVVQSVVKSNIHPNFFIER